MSFVDELFAIKPEPRASRAFGKHPHENVISDAAAAHVSAIERTQGDARTWRADRAKALHEEFEKTRPARERRREELRSMLAGAEVLTLPHETEGHAPTPFADPRITSIASEWRRELEHLDLLDKLVARRAQISADLARTEIPRAPLGAATASSPDDVLVFLWRGFTVLEDGRELSTGRGVTFVAADLWSRVRGTFEGQRARFGKKADAEFGLVLTGDERFDLDRIALRLFGASDVEVEQTHREYRKQVIGLVADGTLLTAWRERTSDAETARVIEERLVSLGVVR